MNRVQTRVRGRIEGQTGRGHCMFARGGARQNGRKIQIEIAIDIKIKIEREQRGKKIDQY